MKTKCLKKVGSLQEAIKLNHTQALQTLLESEVSDSVTGRTAWSRVLVVIFDHGV